MAQNEVTADVSRAYLQVLLIVQDIEDPVMRQQVITKVFNDVPMSVEKKHKMLICEKLLASTDSKIMDKYCLIDGEVFSGDLSNSDMTKVVDFLFKLEGQAFIDKAIEAISTLDERLKKEIKTTRFILDAIKRGDLIKFGFILKLMGGYDGSFKTPTGITCSGLTMNSYMLIWAPLEMFSVYLPNMRSFHDQNLNELRERLAEDDVQYLVECVKKNSGYVFDGNKTISAISLAVLFDLHQKINLLLEAQKARISFSNIKDAVLSQEMVQVLAQCPQGLEFLKYSAPEHPKVKEILSEIARLEELRKRVITNKQDYTNMHLGNFNRLTKQQKQNVLHDISGNVSTTAYLSLVSTSDINAIFTL